MKVKHFNVSIVNIKQQQRVVSRHTHSPYIKLKHFNVNIVNIKQHRRVISRNTYNLYMKVKYFIVNIVNIGQDLVSIHTYSQVINSLVNISLTIHGLISPQS